MKAWDHKTSSLVAMKIVKNERPFLRQAKEEVRILEVLKKQDKQDNLNLVHILDSFKFRGHVCIAFELLGMSLHQVSRSPHVIIIIIIIMIKEFVSGAVP